MLVTCAGGTLRFPPRGDRSDSATPASTGVDINECRAPPAALALRADCGTGRASRGGLADRVRAHWRRSGSALQAAQGGTFACHVGRPAPFLGRPLRPGNPARRREPRRSILSPELVTLPLRE